MKTSSRIAHVSLADALTKGPPPPGNLAVPIFSHGSLAVELYTPVGDDPQKPHTRDEVYFVTRGKGFFFDGERQHAVEAGSFLFVPAGRIHRFEDFSSDFVCGLLFMDLKEENRMANKSAAGKRGIPVLFRRAHARPALPERCRSAQTPSTDR